MPKTNTKTSDSLIATVAPDRIHVSETPKGGWFVRDEADRRGGFFQDRRSAFRFIRDEFGQNAEIVARPKLTATAATRRSNSHQRSQSRRAHATR